MRALALILQRLAIAVPTLAVVVIGIFLLVDIAKGDAADAYVAAAGGGDRAFVGSVRQQFGLDVSLPVRFGRYVIGVVTGDLGQSLRFNMPVAQKIAAHLPPTLLLMGTAIAFATLTGLTLGFIAGAKPGSAADRLLSATALIAQAVPGFCLAMLLILVFGSKFGWLPFVGLTSFGISGSFWVKVMDTARHLVLPGIALGAGYIAVSMRTLRAGMVEAWHLDHVRAARARGLTRPALVWRDVTRPSLSPVVVLTGQQIGTMLGGSVVIETIFAIPGMGSLAMQAVQYRDTPLLAGILLFGAVLAVVASLIVDLILLKLDPRIGEIGRNGGTNG